MKRKKNFSFLLFFVFIVCLPILSGCIVDTNVSQIKDYYYRILEYNIIIDVDENRTCTITEELMVNFDVKSAGLTRMIPRTNIISREDGSTEALISEISDFKIIKNGCLENRLHNISYEFDGAYIELGYATQKEQPIHQYKYQYKYNLGNDSLEKSDEFYFNIIGIVWDCEIYNVNFEINFPKPFDINEADIGVTFGEYGSIDSLDNYDQGGFVVSNLDTSVQVSGNIDYLDAFEALTIRAELDENYFVTVTNYDSLWYILGALVGAAALVMIAYFMWKKYGKDYEIISPVRFYPPDNCDIVDMELHLNERVSTKCIVAMIVDLANKGYLKIEQIGTNNKEKFNIIKVKEYDGNNEKEKNLIQSLFAKNPNSIEAKDLSGELYKYTANLFLKYNSAVGHSKVVEPISLRKASLLIVPLFITVGLLILLPYLYIKANVQGWVFAVSLGIISLIVYSKVKNYKSKHGYIFNILLLSILAIVLPLSLYMVLIFKSWFIIFAIILDIGLFISGLFLMYMRRRTQESTNLLGEILAFKDFLESVEKDKLEELVMHDPTYFYKILPYTYVLGISDKWIEKLNYIHIETPEWLVSNDVTAHGTYVRFRIIDKMFRNQSVNIFTNYQAITAAQKALRVANTIGTIRGIGGRTGGGFSGGGAGGGGGRRR